MSILSTDNENKFAVVTLEYDSFGNQLVLDQVSEFNYPKGN